MRLALVPPCEGGGQTRFPFLLSENGESRMDVDIAVVGAGAGGATLTYALARSGYSVALVEQCRESRLHGADLLRPSGVTVMQQFGVLPRLLERGAIFRHGLEVYHNAELVLDFDTEDNGAEDYFMLVPYATIIKTLRELVAALPNVLQCYGTGVERIEVGEKCCWVKLASGMGLRCQILVGADGGRSIVRQALDIHPHSETYSQQMYQTRVPLTPCVQRRNQLYLDSEGGLAQFYPIDAEYARVVVGFPEAQGEELLADESGARLRKRLQRLVLRSRAAVDLIRETASFARIPARRMHSEVYGYKRGVLLGDAIHNVHPVMGQGMNLSIEDAGVLANEIDLQLQGYQSVQEMNENYLKARYRQNDVVVRCGHALATGNWTPDKLLREMCSR